MRFLPNFKVCLGLVSSVLLLANCVRRPVDKGEKAGVSSFHLDEFKPGAGLPDWSSVDISMIQTDADKTEYKRSIQRAAFQAGKSEDLGIQIAQGRYSINLVYKDDAGRVVYQACAAIRSKIYEIFTPTFKTDLALCLEGSDADAGTVPLVPSGDVANKPKVPQEDSKSDQKDPGNQVCMKPNFGLPTTAAPASRSQYDSYRGQLNLPALSKTASNTEIKTFIGQVYDAYSPFKQVYENDLGLSKRQAMAFMFAVMSRESAQGEKWRIDLETGVGGPGHAWGPFQAAVTNFRGGGYDSTIPGFSGLPIPEMSQFYNPAVSTYVGMKRLADGVLRSVRDFGAGKEAKLYLLGTLADHNTGWPSSATEPSWVKDYGNEVLRLMQAYLYGSNMTNDRAFWTTQPNDQICR